MKIREGDVQKKNLKFGKFYTRYLICVLGSIGMGIIYGLKVNFHVAIVSMVNYTAVGGGDSHGGGEDSKEDGPFVWSKLVQGILLSAYFWGYMISELPGGKLAESLSAKWVMFVAVAANVISALLSPLAAKMHFSALIILRVIQGLGGGVTFPAMHVMLAHWAPPSERSVMSTIVYSGTALGTVTFMLLSGIIAAELGWMWIFYILGGSSSIWLILWLFLATDSPTTTRIISDEEREFIATSLNPDGTSPPSHETPKVPWKAIFTSVPFLAILTAHTCSNWGWYMVLVELPLYMKTVLKFKLEENSFLTALPFLTMWIFSMFFSKIMDILRGKGIISTTTARKIATGVALFGPLVCFVLLCFLDGQTTGVVLMTVAVTFVGAMFCGFLSNHIDIAPNLAGILVAITNTVATIPGILVPFVVSILTEHDPSIASWRIIFLVTVVLYAIGGIVFSIFGSGDEQPWNNPVPPPVPA